MIWEDERIEQEERKKKEKFKHIKNIILCILIGIGLAIIGLRVLDLRSIYVTTKPVVQGVATRDDSAVYWQQRIKDEYDINVVLDATDEKHEFNFDSLSPYAKIEKDGEEVRVRDVAVKQLYDSLGKYNETAREKLKGIYVYVCQDIYAKNKELQGLTVKPAVTPIRVYLSAGGYNEERFDLIIDHELFHVLADDIPDWWLEEYNSIDEGCLTISDYACESIEEELCDAWAYGLSGKKSEKIDLVMKRYKAMLLK